MQSIPGKIGCSAAMRRFWVRHAERDAGRRSGLATDEQALYDRETGAQDNALAATVIGLCKTEVIRPQDSWRNLDDIGYAILE